MNPRLVQSIGWMAFLALLLAGGAYTSYIAPWQQWVLISATALFALLVLIDALVNRSGHQHAHAGHDHHDHDHGNTTDQWVQTLVHLLPLFLFLTMGVTTLGSPSLASITLVAPHSVLSSTYAQPVAPPAVPVETRPPASAVLDQPTPTDQTIAAPGIGDAAVPAAVPLPLMELYFPKKHPGVTRIETIGRLMVPTAEEMAKVPPEIDREDLQLLIYRYVMTCCAADAAPVFAVLRGRATADLKADDWVKITGTWIPAPGPGDMAKVEVDALTVIEQPADPFLQAPME